MRFSKVCAVVIAIAALSSGWTIASADAAAPASPPIEGLESRSADVGNGVILHYWIGGHGPAIVLLHGWPETGYAWRRVAPQLVTAGFTVVVPDLRGFGNSARPAGGYDRQTMADDIHRLIEGNLKLGDEQGKRNFLS